MVEREACRVSIESLFELVAAGTAPLLLDVGAPAEFAAGHLAGARLLPMAELPARLPELEAWRHRPVVTVCRSAALASAAAVLLADAGFQDVRWLDGGMARWQELGYPVVCEPAGAAAARADAGQEGDGAQEDEEEEIRRRAPSGGGGVAAPTARESADGVREAALGLNGELRVVLRDALELTARVEGGDRQAVEPLAEIAAELVELVRRHLAFEEEELGPVLQAMDAWSRERLELLGSLEDVQRRALADTERTVALGGPTAGELVVATHELMRAVLSAVQMEERELLKPDVLRDSVVN